MNLIGVPGLRPGAHSPAATFHFLFFQPPGFLLTSILKNLSTFQGGFQDLWGPRRPDREMAGGIAKEDRDPACCEAEGIPHHSPLLPDRG